MKADAPLLRLAHGLAAYFRGEGWETFLTKLGQRLLENLGQDSRPGALVFACGPAKPEKRCSIAGSS